MSFSRLHALSASAVSQISAPAAGAGFPMLALQNLSHHLAPSPRAEVFSPFGVSACGLHLSPSGSSYPGGSHHGHL